MPQSPHNLRLVVPLIELATKSSNDERQLCDKARGILNNRLAKLKEPLQDVDQKYAGTILDELHIRARKANSSEALETLSHCSLFVCRVLTNIADEKSVLRNYTESIVDFLTRKASSLNMGFFKDFITRYPALGWRLRDAILDTSTKSINAYRKCQAFQLLNVILTLSVSTVKILHCRCIRNRLIHPRVTRKTCCSSFPNFTQAFFSLSTPHAMIKPPSQPHKLKTF